MTDELTEFEYWSYLPEEVKLESLKQLVQTSTSIQDLYAFAFTSRNGHQLAQDNRIWRALLDKVFPASRLYQKPSYQTEPHHLFIRLYQQINHFLAKENLSWSLFETQETDTLATLSAHQTNRLKILKWITGRLDKLQLNTLSQEELDFLFVCSSLTGRDDYIQARLREGNLLLNRDIILRSFATGAYNGNLGLISTFQTNASLVLGKNAILEAIKMALMGQQASVALTLFKQNAHAFSLNSIKTLMNFSLNNQNENFVLDALKSNTCSFSSSIYGQLFQLAAQLGYEKSVLYLLEHYSIYISRRQRGLALKLAACANQGAMVKLLVNQTANDISFPDKKAIVHTEGFKNSGLSLEMLLGARYQPGAAVTKLLHDLSDLTLDDTHQVYAPSFVNAYTGVSCDTITKISPSVSRTESVLMKR